MTDSLISVDQPSCQFRLTYDHNGDVSDIQSTFGAANLSTEHALTQLTRYSHFHICCRRPLDFARIADAIVERPYSIDVYNPTPETLDRLAPATCHNATAIFTNAREFDLLDEHADLSQCRRVVVTDGPRAAKVFTYGTQIAEATPPTVRAVELTGAGDTAAGSFLAAVLTGHSDQHALSQAMEDAARAVQHVGLAW